jgi:hypothetical protein
MERGKGSLCYRGEAYEQPTQSGQNKCIQSYFCVHVIDGERGSGRKIEKISHEVW